MSPAPALGALLAGALLLSGCAADVRGELRRDVAGITDDANARDVEGVRSGVEDLLERLDGAVASGELSSAEAARIADLARVLGERADLLAPEVVEQPTEQPTEQAPPTEEPETEEPETEEPEQEPAPSPSPRPSPSRAPSPSPSPQPEPTQEPEQPVEPTFVPEVPTG